MRVALDVATHSVIPARRVMKGQDFICCDCHAPVIPVHPTALKVNGERMADHYRHKAVKDCAYSTFVDKHHGGDSIEHDEICTEIAATLAGRTKVIESVVERAALRDASGKIVAIPDILVTSKSGNRLAIEFQQSNCGHERIYQRTATYGRLGIPVLWLVPEELIDESKRLGNVKGFTHGLYHLYDNHLYLWSRKHQKVRVVNFTNESPFYVKRGKIRQYFDIFRDFMKVDTAATWYPGLPASCLWMIRPHGELVDAFDRSAKPHMHPQTAPDRSVNVKSYPDLAYIKNLALISTAYSHTTLAIMARSGTSYDKRITHVGLSKHDWDRSNTPDYLWRLFRFADDYNTRAGSKGILKALLLFWDTLVTDDHKDDWRGKSDLIIEAIKKSNCTPTFSDLLILRSLSLIPNDLPYFYPHNGQELSYLCDKDNKIGLTFTEYRDNKDSIFMI